MLMILALTTLVQTRAELPPKLCEVLGAAYSGHFTAKQLCESYGGTAFCDRLSMADAVCVVAGGNFCTKLTMARAICQAGGGSFCDGVKDEVEAVCHVENGSFCDDPRPEDRLRYYREYKRCLRAG